MSCEGAQILTPLSAAREPKPFSKNASHRRKKHFQSGEGAPGKSCEGAQRTMHERRVPSKISKFPGPFAAHETLLPAERAIGGSFLRHFQKAFCEKRGLAPGSFAVLRRKFAVAERSTLARITLVPQEEPISKMCQKGDQIHTSHSAERTVFSPCDA